MTPAPEDRDPLHDMLGGRLRILLEDLFASADDPQRLGAAVRSIREFGDLVLSEGLKTVFEIMRIREEGFRKLRPEMYAELEEGVRDGRIVRGQLEKAAQHPLSAEAMIETALRSDHDFRKLIQVPPSRDEYVDDPLNAQARSALYGMFKWELLQFQEEVNEAAFEKMHALQNRPACEVEEMQRDFPYVDLRLVGMAIERNVLRAGDVFGAITMPASYERMLRDLSDDVAREALRGM